MQKGENKNNRIILVLLVSSIVLILLNFTSLEGGVRSIFQYIYSPISFWGGKSAKNIRDSVLVIPNIGELGRENSELKLKVAQMEAEREYFVLLSDRYKSLSNQILLGKKDWKYLECELVDTSNGVIVNKGSADSVIVGDIVVWNNTYVGRVFQVGPKYSSIVVGSSVKSSLGVMIIKNIDITSPIEAIEKAITSKAIKAVAVGDGREISIQNIPSDAKVVDGDIVVVNDSDVGEYLILGTIKDLKKDKASTVIDAKVSTIFDISDINFVYIKK